MRTRDTDRYDDGVEVANFQLNGWKAVVAIVVVLVGGGWYWWSGTSAKPAPPEVREPLKFWIAANYSHDAVANLSMPGGMGMTDREKAAAKMAMNNIVHADDVTLTEVLIRGDHNDRAVVRAHIEIKGKPAPDGKNIHYYEVEWRSLDREWKVMHEVDEFRWKASAW